jgi:hypothetical protein
MSGWSRKTSTTRMTEKRKEAGVDGICRSWYLLIIARNVMETP